MAVISSSHEEITLPRHHDLGDVGKVQVVLVHLGVTQGRSLGVHSLLLLADVGMVKNVQPLRVRGHDSVLDAVVHHLHKVSGAVGAAVQIAHARRCHPFLPAAPSGAVRGADSGCLSSRSEEKGAGSSRCTTSFSPPIIRQ